MKQGDKDEGENKKRLHAAGLYNEIVVIYSNQP